MYTLAFALVVGDRAKYCSVWSLGSAAPSRTDELVAHTPAVRAASNRRSMVVEAGTAGSVSDAPRREFGQGKSGVL
eukprot:scaffold14613_cov59-Phaeocystis_antarctica.AAC.12